MLDTSKGQFSGNLISDQVYTLLRRSIIEEELTPGERVVESDIARRLGVSQAPVREAVNRLAIEGLLTHVPRRGKFVAEISAEDALQARQVREPLEGLAGALAAERIDDEAIADLEDLVERMHAAVAAQDVTAFRELDIAFHDRVSRIAGNPYLARAWGVLQPSLRALRVIGDPLYGGDWLAMANEHGRLLSLLRAGDPQKAGAAFADHAAGRTLVAEPVSARRHPARHGDRDRTL
jgi:DNA-binding GntR family transcriptional regulator